LLIAALFVGLAPQAATLTAQQPQAPIASISVAPLDRAIPEMSYLLNAMNIPEMVGVMEMMTGFYTKGLDRSRPIAILVSFDGTSPDFQVCVPMKDHKQWFQIMSGMGLDPEELAEGLYEISAAGQVMIAKVANGWMYLGQSEDSLSTVPEDPAALLGDLPERYSFSAKIDLQQLPADMRDSAIAEMRAGFERTMQQQLGDQFDSELDAAQEAALEQMEQLEDLISDTQQLVIGCLIDPTEKKLVIDGAIQFLEGSDLAKQMDAQADLKSDFTALRPEKSSGYLRATSVMSNDKEKELAKESLRDSIEQTLEMIRQQSELPQEYMDAFQSLIEGIESIAQQSIDQGVLDGALSFDFEQDELRLLAGVKVADGKDVQQKLKDFLGGLPQSGEVQAEFDVASHAGFQLHQATIKLPKTEEISSLGFGESAQLSMAGSGDVILLCLGADGLATLKSAIDRLQTTKGVQVTPLEGSARAGSLARLAQSLRSDAMLEELVPAFDLLSEDDTIKVTGTILPRGMVMRVSLDEGVLRALGTVLKSGNFAPGF
jgi:hypothetical protein